MTSGAGRLVRNAGSFLRKELGEALRNTENSLVEMTPLSSVACGATSFLRKEAKICAVRRHHNPQRP